MNINPHIFKAYDVRGIYAKDFDEDMAYKLGLCYVAQRQQELGSIENMQIVVGGDMRLSTPVLKDSLIKGLIDAGVTVIDIGQVATPTFYYAVADYKTEGGIMISASHNPKEYNGFKVVREQARPMGLTTGLEELRQLVMNCQDSLSDRELKRHGHGQIVTRYTATTEMVKFALEQVDIAALKPFKIVVDPANAMGSTYFDALAKLWPCQVEQINWPLDGSFPAHTADPFDFNNLKQLGQAVREQKADLGIATDGDADRLFFVDETGTPLIAGVTRAILCKIFLADKPGAKICYDVRPGRITPETITTCGGTPIVTKVGHSLIKSKMMSTGAYFAGESSGHFFLNLPVGCFEMPIIVILKFLLELSKSGGSLSQLAAPYNKYFDSGEINSEVPDVAAVLQRVKQKYADGQLDELDGISVTYPDYWFNVRGSNTEPLIRLNLEATTKEVMEAKRDEVLGVITGGN